MDPLLLSGHDQAAIDAAPTAGVKKKKKSNKVAPAADGGEEGAAAPDSLAAQGVQPLKAKTPKKLKPLKNKGAQKSEAGTDRAPAAELPQPCAEVPEAGVTTKDSGNLPAMPDPGMSKPAPGQADAPGLAQTSQNY